MVSFETGAEEDEDAAKTPGLCCTGWESSCNWQNIVCVYAFFSELSCCCWEEGHMSVGGVAVGPWRIIVQSLPLVVITPSHQLYTYCVAGTIGRKLMYGKPIKIDLDKDTYVDVRCQSTGRRAQRPLLFRRRWHCGVPFDMVEVD